MHGEHGWQLDGRNPRFHDELVKSLKLIKQPGLKPSKSSPLFVVNLQQLFCDPFLKQPLIDQLVPKKITDAVYQAMQDKLCALAREFVKDAADKETVCHHIRRFFRIAIKDPKQFLNDDPTLPDHQLRKRVFLVYDRVFEPLLGSNMREKAYHELELIIRNCDSCIDAARRTLLVMEQHPNMSSMDAPNLFERLAVVLKNYRLDVLRETAEYRSKIKRKNDPVEYDLFMRNAFGLALSTGVEACDQMYLGFIAYEMTDVPPDADYFLHKYREGMIRAVMKAIKYNGKPSADSDTTKIYMEDVFHWAIELSSKYANSYEPDKDLMEGASIRPKVVAHLLEEAGYLERVK
jgi:hypothetical protein